MSEDNHKTSAEKSAESLHRFHDYLRLELNRSQLTCEAYIRDIRQYANWVTGNGSVEFDATHSSPADIRAWLTSLARVGDSPRSIRRKTQSLRAYYRYLQKQGWVTSNPAAEVQLAKISKPLPEFALPEEIERLLAKHTDRNDPEITQSRLILLLLYSTGIRQAELLGLRDPDISCIRGEAVVTGKRDKQRIVPLASELCKEICQWQKMRDHLYPHLPEPRPLFVEKGKPLTKSRLYTIVSKMLADTGASHKGAHTLRHTFATAMLNNGADIDAVKEFLGHASLSTTQIYTHLSYTQLLRDYRSAHPRAENQNNTADHITDHGESFEKKMEE